MTAVFLFAPQTDAKITEPLSLWGLKVTAPAMNRAQSFGERPSQTEETSVWSIKLPADDQQAYQDLARQAAMLNQRERTAETVNQYLHLATPPARTAESFNTGQPSFQEEWELWQHLDLLPESRAESLSFSAVTSGREVRQQFRQFMGQVSYLLRPTMQINSDQAGFYLAQTIVRASGGLETVWRDGLDLPQRALHQEVVETTLATRLAVLRFLSHIVTGAAALAARLAVAPALALPAAFRFTYNVIRRAHEEQLFMHMQQLSALKT
jgi:hypothetical protein